jgi:diketogulonate reductase-like aldo/keto reductase
MERRPFGPTRVMVPIIGQGTWTMERDRTESTAALRRGIERGMTHIDTAEMYGSGAVEEVVGEAIRGRRDEVFLVTKVLPSNATYRGTIEACERSLRRLRTHWLDVYLLHSPSTHPLEETIKAFRELMDQGKIRAFGISNFAGELLEEAAAMGRPEGVAANQVLYHLKDRWIEHGLIEDCFNLDVAVVGYSPFGQGDFPSDGPVLAEIAAAHHATPRQVALRFLLRHPGTFVIPKSSTIAHVEENAGAADFVLEPDEIARIDAAFPTGPVGAGLSRL